ncbi:endonuclease domain-containing protein [Marinomonas pontica]
MSERIFNLKKNHYFRVNLRETMPEPERRLWRHIRGRQLGMKFRRQHGIGPYIVDFYCPEKRLVIEIDGDSHYNLDTQVYDRKRDDFMRSLGLQVMRFTNQDILENLGSVLEVVLQSTQPTK